LHRFLELGVAFDELRLLVWRKTKHIIRHGHRSGVDA
jgi:hypothetical protein